MNFGLRIADLGAATGSAPPNHLLNSQSAFRNPQFYSDLGANRMKKELEARTKRFALSVIIELVGKLPRGKASDVIGYQLLKSGNFHWGQLPGSLSRAIP